MTAENENSCPAKRKTMTQRLSGNAGLTLIELMIAVGIFGIVIAGVVGAFYDQLKSHNTQQQILAMHQNARATMYFISRELRMAGYDPTGTAGAGFTIDKDSRETITFSMDIAGEGNDGADNDGDTLIDDDDADETGMDPDGAINGIETITYSLDPGTNRILRTVNGVTQTLAVNMDALDFECLGVRDPTPVGCANSPDLCYLGNDELQSFSAFNMPQNIRAIQVGIVARNAFELAVGYNVSDTQAYNNLQGSIMLNTPNDRFRRVMLNKEIKLRNMGLN